MAVIAQPRLFMTQFIFSRSIWIYCTAVAIVVYIDHISVTSFFEAADDQSVHFSEVEGAHGVFTQASTSSMCLVVVWHSV